MTHVTRRPAILGGPGGYASPPYPPPPPYPSTPTFLRSKKKKGKQREKRKTFKAKTIKSLSPRKAKCYCFSHSRASRIQKFFWSANHGGRQYLSVFHSPSTLKSKSNSSLFTILFTIKIRN